jgi:olefin beta-lactone synthetase
VLYPFSIEALIEEVTEVRHAAVLSISGKRVLFVELERASELPDLATVMDCLLQAKIDRVEIVTKIPVDSRHNSKVDYPALLQQIKTAGFSNCIIGLR